MVDSSLPMDLSSPKGSCALEIVKRLTKAGHQALFAGGCVRDHLLGEKPTDYDIATTAIPDTIEKLFEKTVAVGKQFGVMLVIMQGMQFEVATFRTEGGYQDGRHPGFVNFSNAEEDSSRRDFTVNGLFYDPLNNKVLDYVGGLEDLKLGVIRSIGDATKRFEEDKLRLLRAIRFSAKLGFSVEQRTWEEVKRLAPQIVTVSAERIRDEIDKIWMSNYPHKGLSLLAESGLWKILWPQIDPSVIERFKNSGQLTIPLACSFLFYGLSRNEILGQMRRLRYSNDVIQTALRILDLQKQMDAFEQLRPGEMKQLVSDPDYPGAFALYICLPHSDRNVVLMREKSKEWSHLELPEPLLNGEDLKTLGLAPGPKIREVLKEAYLGQLEGAFHSKAAALGWAEKEIKKFQED